MSANGSPRAWTVALLATLLATSWLVCAPVQLIQHDHATPHAHTDCALCHSLSFTCVSVNAPSPIATPGPVARIQTADEDYFSFTPSRVHSQRAPPA